jgi:hypothetical protein
MIRFVRVVAACTLVAALAACATQPQQVAAPAQKPVMDAKGDLEGARRR